MNQRHRTLIGAAVGAGVLLVAGAPLVAQGGDPGITYPKVKPATPAAGASTAQKRDDARKGRGRAKAGKATLYAPLLGRNEISPEGRRNAGDRNGSGAATVVLKGGSLCFAVAVEGIGTPNGLHVHAGKKNATGDVVVALTHPSGGDPGASAGCVPVEADLAARITRKPNSFYVNIHNEEFPGGALRGQLRKAPRG